jgi:hypothetical protein
MSRIEKIEEEIRALSPEELTRLRKWFRELDAEAWDREIEADARSGKLDALAEEALRAHRSGESSPL